MIKVKKFKLVCLAVLSFTLLAGCGAQTTGKTESSTSSANSGDSGDIVVGMVNSETGDYASAGVYIKDGVKMAVDEWNEKGGINGKKIKLIIQDDQSTPAGAVNAFNKLTSENKLTGFVAPGYSVLAMAIMPNIDKIGIPTVTGSTNPKITTMGNKWMFRSRTNDEIMAKLAAQYAVEKVSDQVAIIHDNNEFGSGGADAVKAALEAMKVKVLDNEGYNSGDKDFSAQLLNIKKSGAKVLIGWGHPLEDGLILQQIKQLGLNIKVVGAAPYGQPVTLDLAKDAANGIVFVQEYSSANSDPKVQEWAKKFKANYNIESDFNAAGYYDGTNLLLTGIQKAKSLSAQDIRDSMLNIKDYQGICGPYGFDANGEGFRSAVIVKVDQGKLNVIDQVTMKS
ncbi:ABC transporter substrate-binding protein [Desulfitobacterium sp. AusDCA]|uniref:ABC transporter substrate-binding protein n=1 Tax=Desulfitobacterium sp. AusDCA TaxID=3240383 RepID=UPI003DA723B4